jgi:hypothetical protein
MSDIGIYQQLRTFQVFWTYADAFDVLIGEEMQPADRDLDPPRGRGLSHPLLLEHDVFFGQLQSTRSTQGVTLSHRIANSPPEEVEVHTHLEPHFVLVTSGRYISSAKATPNRNATIRALSSNSRAHYRSK